jgi:hypothetical protein
MNKVMSIFLKFYIKIRTTLKLIILLKIIKASIV